MANIATTYSTSISAAVITNALIFDAWVTQQVTQYCPNETGLRLPKLLHVSNVARLPQRKRLHKVDFVTGQKFIDGLTSY